MKFRYTRWFLILFIVFGLLACGSGESDNNDDQNTDQTIENNNPTLISHLAGQLGDMLFDDALLPANPAIIHTSGLISSDIQVQLTYPNKIKLVTPASVSLVDQQIRFIVPGNAQEGQLSLLIADKSTPAISYRVIEEKTPRLVEVLPVSVTPGELVTITGEYLPEDEASLVFERADVTHTINVMPNNNSISFSIPANFTTGLFHLKLGQFETNSLYLAVKRQVSVTLDVADGLDLNGHPVSFVAGGEEVPVDSLMSASITVENNQPEIVHSFIEINDQASVLYSAVVLPDMSGPIIFDAKSTAIAWTMLGMLSTGNLSSADQEALYDELDLSSSIQDLSGHIELLQLANTGQWLNQQDDILVDKFRAVALEVAQNSTSLRSQNKSALRGDIENSFLTITHDQLNDEIYIDDYDYSDYSYSSKLINGSVTIINDTQMYLSVEARSIEDNSIINGYQHSEDVFYSEPKTLLSPKGWGLLSISSYREIELLGKDARIEIVTGASVGETDKYDLHRKLRARLLLDGVFVPMTNTFLNMLIDLNVPDYALRKSVYDVMNSIYGSSFITDLAGYYESDNYSLSGMISLFFINPLKGSLEGCWSVPVREGCTKLITAFAFVMERYGPLKNARLPDLISLILTEIKMKLVSKAFAVSTGLGSIVAAFDASETAIYAVADGVTVAESLYDLSTNPRELNVDVEFALKIDDVNPKCIAVEPTNNSFTLTIDGKGLMAADETPPSVYLGLWHGKTPLSLIGIDDEGTELSATDDPYFFAVDGSDFHYLFIEYDDNVFAEFLEPIQFIDINDNVVSLESIEPAQTESGSVISLKGCGWIPLDEIQVHFQTMTGELAVTEVESKTIDEIQVRVPDEAVSGMVYVTAGLKTTTKQYLDLKTFSLSAPDSAEIDKGQSLTLNGKGLDEVQSVFFFDQSGNYFSADIGGFSSVSIDVTVPDTLSAGLIKAYARRADGKLTNEIDLVIRPSLVTASPGEISFVESIEVTLSQPEDLDIYFRIEDEPYQLYTDPITLLSSETEYEYISLFTYANVELNGIDYDSQEREFRYTPCADGEIVEGGVCVVDPSGPRTTCPATYDAALDNDSYVGRILFYHNDKDNDGSYEDYLRCDYFSTGELEIQVPVVDYNMQGLRIRYLISGLIWTEGYYFEGQRHGVYKEYSHINGTRVISCIIYDMGSIDSYCETGPV